MLLDASYPSDVSDAQWAVLAPLLARSSKRGPKHGDLRSVVNGVLYVVRTGCPWRYLPIEYGPWTRIWSQFRRWSRNGTWDAVLVGLHEQARIAAGREKLPSALVIDSSLARGASLGGVTFHDRGGPYGATKGAKRVVAVDVTGLPVGVIVVPALTTESKATELLLEHLVENTTTSAAGHLAAACINLTCQELAAA